MSQPAAQARKTNPALFYLDDEVAGGAGLKGMSCPHCGTVVLQEQPVCPRCLARDMAPVCIGRRATLGLSSRVHHSADGFEAPYVIARVHTEEGPSALAPILVPIEHELTVGLPLRFVLLPRPDGRVGFAYAPDEAAA